MLLNIEIVIAVIFLASCAQAATGVGFGVIAGPILMQSHGYESAIAETAALSLLVALINTGQMIRATAIKPMQMLSVSLIPGLAMGWLFSLLIPTTALLLIFGCVLLFLACDILAIQIKKQPINITYDNSIGKKLFPAGLAAGIGAYLFATPGPAAAWGLTQSKLSAEEVRATLASYFLVAYSAVLLTFFLSGRMNTVNTSRFSYFAVSCAIGAILGAQFGKKLSIFWLRKMIGIAVFCSGASLIVKAIHTYSN